MGTRGVKPCQRLLPYVLFPGTMKTMHQRPRYGDAVLRRFGLSDQELLGSGGESRVYALDDDRVLRVFGPGATEAKVDGLGRFYETLDVSHVDFAVPDILEAGRQDDLVYSVESRLPGRDLSAVFEDLGFEARTRALRGLARAAGEVRKLRHGFDNYGELLADSPMSRDSWSRFLIDRAMLTLRASRTRLARDVPDLDRVVARWKADVHTLIGSPAPELVHGDFFPGNVLVDDSGKLTAVIDFSPMTICGDWRLDVAGAEVFLELGDMDRPDDRQIVKHELNDRYHVPADVIDVYRRYYALYFSAAGTDDPPLYGWCVRQLTQRSQE